MSVYKDGVEQMYVHFDVSGDSDTRNGFYTEENSVASSFTDLKNFDTDCAGRGGAFFSMEG